MPTWVTHLMVADEVIKQMSFLSRHEFFVGNIAPIVMWKMRIGQTLHRQEK